ncbi:MAG: hypothetical protein ACLS61_14610 [Ruminococcus sp.]
MSRDVTALEAKAKRTSQGYCKMIYAAQSVIWAALFQKSIF